MSAHSARAIFYHSPGPSSMSPPLDRTSLNSLTKQSKLPAGYSGMSDSVGRGGATPYISHFQMAGLVAQSELQAAAASFRTYFSRNSSCLSRRNCR